jgi:multiple antibiotic resistance protein
MIDTVVSFLVMLNPFALFIYLAPVMKELSHRNFTKVLFKASLISFGIFFFFLLSGNFFFEHVLLINFEAFRIFGGIVIFSFAYLYIVKGNKALVQMKESLDDLASEVALPFMIGAGTISLTIIMGNESVWYLGVMALIGILVVNACTILLLKYIKDHIEKKKFKIAFDKNMEILLRLNGFFVGAIGVNMMITGISRIFF